MLKTLAAFLAVLLSGCATLGGTSGADEQASDTSTAFSSQVSLDPLPATQNDDNSQATFQQWLAQEQQQQQDFLDQQQRQQQAQWDEQQRQAAQQQQEAWDREQQQQLQQYLTQPVQ